jgi:hypothetical protein
MSGEKTHFSDIHNVVEALVGLRPSLVASFRQPALVRTPARRRIPEQSSAAKLLEVDRRTYH